MGLVGGGNGARRCDDGLRGVRDRPKAMIVRPGGDSAGAAGHLATQSRAADGSHHQDRAARKGNPYGQRRFGQPGIRPAWAASFSSVLHRLEIGRPAIGRPNETTVTPSGPMAEASALVNGIHASPYQPEEPVYWDAGSRSRPSEAMATVPVRVTPMARSSLGLARQRVEFCSKRLSARRAVPC